MPISTNALNYMINNVRAIGSGFDDNVFVLFQSTPPNSFNDGTIPQSCQTDLVPMTFGSASSGIRTLSSSVVLTSRQQAEDASFLAIYSRSEVPRSYTLVAYVDVPIIQLDGEPTLVTVRESLTSIGLANV